MKRFLSVLIAVLFFSGLALSGAVAAEKYAYVDLATLFADYGKTKDYDKVLTDKEDIYNKDREKKVNDIKKLQDSIEVLGDKQKAAKKLELDEKVKVLNEFDREKMSTLRKEQDEKMREIFKDIEDAVKKYAEKEGYTMIFNDKVLVYKDAKLNITSAIQQALNKGYVKK